MCLSQVGTPQADSASTATSSGPPSLLSSRPSVFVIVWALCLRHCLGPLLSSSSLSEPSITIIVWVLCGVCVPLLIIVWALRLRCHLGPPSLLSSGPPSSLSGPSIAIIIWVLHRVWVLIIVIVLAFHLHCRLGPLSSSSSGPSIVVICRQ